MHSGCDDTVPLNSDDNNMIIQSQNLMSEINQIHLNTKAKELQNPVFNFHFHISTSEMNELKLLLPGVQPIVHFHFNGESRSLQPAVVGDNGEAANKLSTNNLDDVELSGINNSVDKNERKEKKENERKREEKNKKNESNILKSGNTRVLRSSVGLFSGRVTRSQAIKIENKIEKNTVSKNIYEINDSKSKKNVNGNKNISRNKSCGSHKKTLSHTQDKEGLNLTTPVVVLKDICKENSHVVIKAKKQDEHNEEGDIKDSVCPVVDSESLESNGQLSGSHFEYNKNNTNDNKSLKKINTTPSCSGRILTELAEGCNFSDIIRRFLLDYGGYISDTQGSKAGEDESCPASSDKVEIKLQTSDSFENQSLVEEQLNIGINNLGGNVLDKMGDLPSEHLKEQTGGIDFDNRKLSGHLQSTLLGDSTEETEKVTNQFEVSVINSDPNKCTAGVQSSSGKVCTDQEILNSSSVTTKMVDSERCNDSEMHEGHLNDLRNSDSDLIKNDKEMRGRTMLTTNNSKSKNNEKSKRKSKESKFAHTPKKRRKTNKTIQKLPAKEGKSDSADYIPLNASGPTRFGVAMLEKIQPFRKHDAKDFRSKMLFGDRVHRYSSPQDLRMFKLKQKATRLSN